MTCEELEKDWIFTQSCGTFFGLGFGVVLGVGLGVVLELGLAVGVGLELGFFEVEALGVGVAVLLGVGDLLGLGLALLVGSALGLGSVVLLGVGLALAELLGLELDVGDFDGLAGLLGVELADLLGVELVRVVVGDALAGDLADFGDDVAFVITSAAASSADLGTDAQAALTMGPLAELVARASPDMLAVRKANPDRTPTTTGFASCALTRETSLRCSFWSERLSNSHYALAT